MLRKKKSPLGGALSLYLQSGCKMQERLRPPYAYGAAKITAAPGAH